MNKQGMLPLMVQISRKNLYCLGLHYKCFYEQGINHRAHDSAEPCRICEYNKVCRLGPDYSSMEKTLEKLTGITVNHYAAP